MQYFSYTEKGPKLYNEDYFVIKDIPKRGVLLVVADGVGGSNSGSEASINAVEKFSVALLDKSVSLKEALVQAHEYLIEIAKDNSSLSGMATTLAAVLIDGDQLKGVNCGDSRVYLLRENGLKQLTVDHNEANKLFLEGKISVEETNDYPRKHILCSALGSSKDLLIKEFKFQLNPKDRVLLLSDGVYGLINKSEIRDMSLNSSYLSEFGKNLIDFLSVKKANDNQTFIISEID